MNIQEVFKERILEQGQEN